MPNAFNFSASPFDSLTNQEQALVRARVDIAYFREGDIILDVGAAPEHLYVLIKGRVAQLDGEETLHSYGPDDTFWRGNADIFLAGEGDRKSVV